MGSKVLAFPTNLTTRGCKIWIRESPERERWIIESEVPKAFIPHDTSSDTWRTSFRRKLHAYFYLDDDEMLVKDMVGGFLIRIIFECELTDQELEESASCLRGLLEEENILVSPSFVYE